MKDHIHALPTSEWEWDYLLPVLEYLVLEWEHGRLDRSDV